jgi:methylated-DNA-protein-cysteine methyltransferase-like protein
LHWRDWMHPTSQGAMLRVSLRPRGGGAPAGTLQLPAGTATTGADLRRSIAEQLPRLTAAEQLALRLVLRGTAVQHDDAVTPRAHETLVAILPRGYAYRPAAASSPPDDGSPSDAGATTHKRRRRPDGGCEPSERRRPATFTTVPSAVQRDFAWRVHRVVEAIPRGKVCAYGQVARYAGSPRNARQVGKLLATALSGGVVPWQRVINAAGGISLPADGGGDRQRKLLAAEGVRFKESGNAVVPDTFWAPEPATITALFFPSDAGTRRAGDDN